MDDTGRLTPDDVNNLLSKILTEREILEEMLVNPNNILYPDYLIFLVYVLPVLNVTSLALLVVLHYLLWGPKFFHKYGYMSLYSILEWVQSSIECVVISVIYFRGKNYIEYEWCHTYFIMSFGVPFALYSWSQWIKVGQALQRTMMVYLPITYKLYIKRRNLLVIAGLISIISAIIPALQIMYRNVASKKMADSSAKKVVSACIFAEKGNALLNKLSGYGGLIFVDCVPVVLMAVLSLMMVRKIHLQNKFRRQFQGPNPNTCEMDRMLNVVAITTTFFVICTLPRIIDVIVVDNKYRDIEIIAEALLITQKSLRCVSIPFTFFLFGSLSAAFRKTCKKLTSCAWSQLDKRTQESAKQ